MVTHSPNIRGEIAPEISDISNYYVLEICIYSWKIVYYWDNSRGSDHEFAEYYITARSHIFR